MSSSSCCGGRRQTGTFPPLFSHPLGQANPFLSFLRAAFVKPEDSDVFSSPRKITKNLAASRIENATLRDRANSHELEVQRRDRIIGQLEARAMELEGKLEEATKELKQAEEKRRVESSQANLLRQEVGMLKRHLVRLLFLPYPSFY